MRGLSSIRPAWIERVGWTDRDVELLVPIAIEISKDEIEGSVGVCVPTFFTPKVAAFSARVGQGGVDFGSGEHVRLTERFTRVDATTIEYEFTVNDPSTFTKPFTGRFPMNLADGRIYEYACHEGNYGLENILRAGRAEDVPASTVSGVPRR